MRRSRIPFYSIDTKNLFIVRLCDAISLPSVIAALFGGAADTSLTAKLRTRFETQYNAFIQVRMQYIQNKDANKDAMEAQLNIIWPTARDIVGYLDSMYHQPDFPATIYTQIQISPPHRNPAGHSEPSHNILHAQVKLGESPYTVVIKAEAFTLNAKNEHKRSHRIFMEHPETHERYWHSRHDTGDLEIVVPIGEQWKGYIVVVTSCYLDALNESGDPSPEVTLLLPGIPGPAPTDLHKEPTDEGNA